MSPSDQRPPDEPGAPAVGNILGFSLLFRDRKALLALPRRGLAPGVRLRDYEAEIPGVRFPLRGPLTATKFRLRRCRALQATLSVERRALLPWLQARLVGVEHLGFRITDVDLDLRARFPGTDAARVLLVLAGVGRDGARAWLLHGLTPTPAGSGLELHVTHRWVFGEPSIDAASVWRTALRRLAPEVIGIDAHHEGWMGARVDPARLALTRPFVSAGWKVPDTRALGLETLSLSRRGIELELREGANGAFQPEPPDDAIGRALESVREGLRTGDPLADLLEELEIIGDSLAGLPAARIACVRWRVQLARYRDPRATLSALREWLDLQPSAAQPRRQLAVTLARAGELTELAQLLAADCRLRHPPRTQARLELALATLLGERLDDARTALAIVGPLVARLRQDPDVADLLPPALVTLAAARAAEASRVGRRAPHALEALDEALERTDTPLRRADHRARVAEAFARGGAPEAALALMARAVTDAPGDPELLDRAIDLALQVGERTTAADLLRLRLEASEPTEQADLRRRLIGVLLELDDPSTLGVALDEVRLALEVEPDSIALLRAAADLELRAGDSLGAAESLQRITDLLDDDRERVEVDLERARLLLDRHRNDEAWDALRPWLDAGDPELAESRLEAMELAIGLAPPTDRARLLDRLIEEAAGPRRGRALLERAAQAIDVRARMNDLRSALDEIDDPAAALAQLEPLLDQEDPEALLDLADWAQDHGHEQLEARCRGRAGLRLADEREPDLALVQLERALELNPRRDPLRVAASRTLEVLGRPEAALEHLMPLLEPQRAARSGEPRARLAADAARLLVVTGDDQRAADALRLAIQEAGQAIDDRPEGDQPLDWVEHAHAELFAVLYRLGRADEARALAQRRAEEGPEPLRAPWLVRAAGVASPAERMGLLERAATAAPEDPEVSDAYAAALREAERWSELEVHLRGRLARADDDEVRRRLLERLLGLGSALDDGVRIELYRDLAALEPDHPDALLALARAARDAGDEAGALDRMRRLGELLSTDDPRGFEPALALAEDALERSAAAEARAHLERALALGPDDPTALELMRRVAHELGDIDLVQRAVTALLAKTTDRRAIAALELERAQAHASKDEGAHAFAALERAANHVEAGSAQHLEVAELWLSLALRRGSRDAEASARAELRRALGPDLPLDELREEIRLLIDELGRSGEALMLVEDGIVAHQGDAVLVALVARVAAPDAIEHIDDAEIAERAVDVLRNVVDRVPTGEPRDRVAWSLARAARSQDEAALVLLGLDRLSVEQAETDEALTLRHWAVHMLGRVDEERAAVDAALAESDGPPSAALLRRLQSTYDGDAVAAAEHLLAVAARVDLARGVAMAEFALRSSPRPWSAELALRSARILARKERLSRAGWTAIADDVLAGGSAEQAAEFIELIERASFAAGTEPPEEGQGWLEGVLDRALARFPDALPLHQILVRRSAPDGEEETSQVADRLEQLARRHDIGPSQRAQLLVSFASELDEPHGSEMLLRRALAERDPGVRRQLEAALRDWGAWSALLRLMEASSDAPGSTDWEDLASAAAATHDFDTEGRARAHEGEALLAEGEDEEATRALARALDLGLDRPDLSLALGLALTRLGRREPALERLLPLLEEGDGEGWMRAGAEPVDLCRRCAAILLELEQPDRAATLLARGRREATGGSRERAELTGELHRALLHAGREDEAWRLAALAAEESDDDHLRLQWLRRAVEQAPARERSNLLVEALTLAPEDVALTDQLETTLEELDDGAQLEALLRRRITHELAGDELEGSRAIATGARIDRLVALCTSRGAPPSSLAELWRQRLSLDPDHPDSLLALGALAQARGDLDEASAMWRRAQVLLPEEDERLLEPARLMIRWRLESEDALDAAVWARRALTLRPDEPELLRTALHLGRATEDWDLLALAAEGLLRGELEAPESTAIGIDLSRALDARGEPEAALDRAEQTAHDAPVGTSVHASAAEHWLSLLLARPEPRDETRLEMEARARASLRSALGDELSPEQLRAEAELLADRLGRLDSAIELAERSLQRQPEAIGPRELLQDLCARDEDGERLLVSLRRVVELVERGEERDQLAGVLARHARQREAARTVISAIESMSSAAAGASEMLDLRDWAVRATGKVDDELETLRELLTRDDPESIHVDRLLRILERDPGATADELLSLRGRAADPGARRWLTEQAFEVLHRHHPGATEALAGVLATLLEEGLVDQDGLLDRWQRARAGVDPQRAIGVDALLDVARRALAMGHGPLRAPAQGLVAESLRHQPARVALHRWLLEPTVFGGDADGALAFLDEQLGAALELAAARVELIAGLAEALGEDAGTDFLQARAGAAIGEQTELARLLIERLRRRGATAIAGRLLSQVAEVADVEPTVWLALAEEAHTHADAETEQLALGRAADRLVDEERFEEAIEPLRQLVELRPDDRVHAIALAGSLEACERPAEAVQILLPLLDGDTPERAHLALRATTLAERAGDRAHARELAARTRTITSQQASEAPGDDLTTGLHQEATGRLFDLAEADEDAAMVRAIAEEEALALGEEPADPDRAIEWLVRAADLQSSADVSADLLGRALALRPGDEALASRVDAVLEQLGDEARLTSHLRERVTRALDLRVDDGTASARRLDRLGALIPAEDRDARTWLLESQLRLRPDDPATLLELAAIREAGGDAEGARVLWRRLESVLPPEDPRYFAPATALAAAAAREGALRDAVLRYERALALRPDELPVLDALLELAVQLDDSALILRVAPRLESLGGGTRGKGELLGLVAGAHQRAGDSRAALENYAAALANMGPDDEQGPYLARRWIAVATDSALPAQLAELATEHEAWARAALRRVLAAESPVADLRAEANLIATRLARPDEGVALLADALGKRPHDLELRQALEELCLLLEQPSRYLRELERIVGELEGEPGWQLGEHLVLAARSQRDAELTMRALERLPEDRRDATRLVEAREWAVRTLGQADAEIERLEGSLRDLDPDQPDLESRALALGGRVLRLLDGDIDAWAARTHVLAESVDARVASTLLMRALDVALTERPGDLRLGLLSLARAREFAPPELLVQPWRHLARNVPARGDTEDVFELLDVAVDLELTVPDFQAVDDLALQIFARIPDHEATHRSLYRRAETQSREDELGNVLARLASELELEGQTLAGFFSAAGDVMPRAAAERMLAREALSHVDDPVVWDALLDALRRRHCWSAIADLLLDRPPGRRTDAARHVEQLVELADQAREYGDDQTELRALIGAGLDAARTGQHERTIEALTRASDLDGERIDLQATLGRSLAATGRDDAALERLLPLLDPPWPTPEQLGHAPEELARLCVGLLERVGASERAVDLLQLMLDQSLAAQAGAVTEGTGDAAERLHALLSRLGRGHAAVDLATHMLEHASPDSRGTWLVRAAAGGELADRLVRLREAAQLEPDNDEFSEALVAALVEGGERVQAITLLRARLAERRTAGGPRIEALAARLLGLLDDEDEGVDAEREELLGLLSTRRPDDPDVLLALAPLRAAQGQERDAVAMWQRLEQLLDTDDDRFFRPALELARRAQTSGELERARALLERALQIRPGDAGALALQLGVAQQLDEPALWLRCAEALLAHEGEQPRAQLEMACARAHRRLSDVEAAHAAYERACGLALPGSEQHREYAREWLVMIRDPETALSEANRHDYEARGRSELRKALGEELGPEALRAEAVLLATHLGRVEEALEITETGLARAPTDELLLSVHKDLAMSSGEVDRFLAALERAVHSAEGDVCERLATELAYLAVELEDPRRLLAALERVSPDRAASPELLDLREWAVRKLGRVEDELASLRAELRGDGHPERALRRLVRMLDGDLDLAMETLGEVADEAGPERASSLFEAALRLASDAHPGEAAGVIRILEGAVAHLEHDLAHEPLLERWPRLELVIVESGDTELLARLAELSLEGVDAGVEGLRPRSDDLLGLMLLREPDAASLHRLLFRRARRQAEGSDTDPVPVLVERLERLARRLHVRGYTAARMWAGLAEQLERGAAADLLSKRARAALEHDPEAFGGLLEALEDRSHWPDAIALLEARIESAPGPQVRVEALKHLAHIRADILGDATTAIEHLEQALEHAPEDPDLLLPLLDHHYAQRDLGPAVELSIRVMEHVPMGDAAFTALGHRAADAALARGDHRMAERLLERVLERCPNDVRTGDRLVELRRVADDPEHRVRMLGAIAARQKGPSRIDALEERARLLIEPLGRIDDAIADLETVLDESMERAASLATLEELYVRRERWADLVTLLERAFPRQFGLERARTLRRIAGLHQDRLFDLGEAEQALRVAREGLGDTDEELVFGDEIDLQLARCLELQGRYGEIATHLEGVLEAELRPDYAQAPRPSRLTLLEELARVLRDYVEDEERAARTYEQLERLGRLPEEGLATLARWYRQHQRHEDLVRVLKVRANALAEAGDRERKAELDRRIGELLEGPLRRPHEAARHFLDAYLADPEENRGSGARARVLLAGTDSVVNVRRHVLEQLEGLPRIPKAYGLSLLGDLLAPQEDFEEEAERRYREALQLSPELGAAQEGLGRLLARQGRLADAAEPLAEAARNPNLEPERAAEAAATAARALLILARADEAEAVLRDALQRTPEAQRALLELARLYHRIGRRKDEADVLDRLSELPLSSLLGAEVAFRKAMLLEDEFREDPFSQAGELARAHLLEAVGADAMHAQARQILLDLATRRSEWSIVAHMHFLAIRELQPGTQRALTHLDLAQTYLQRLHDEESALRNLLSALTQPGNDLVVRQRAFVLGERLTNPGRAATAAEKLAREHAEIDEIGRARLFLLAAELFARGDDPEASEKAAQRAIELEGADAQDREAAKASLAALGDVAFELKKERSALRRELESSPQGPEHLSILSRLHQVARALEDEALAQESERRLVETAQRLLTDPEHLDRATDALRDHFAGRGDYERLVRLYEQLAASATGPQRRAELLTTAARYAWSGLRDTKLGLAILRRALGEMPNLPEALGLLGEIADAQEDPDLDTMICDELGSLSPDQISTQLAVRLSDAARRIGRDEHAQRVLRQVLSRQLDPAHRLEALESMDALLREDGRTRERLPVLGERLGLARAHDPPSAVDIALELASAQRDVGALTDARATLADELRVQSDDDRLLAMQAELLAQAEDWPALAATLEALARVRTDPTAQAEALAEAAKIIVAHGDGTERRARARALLTRARETDPRNTQARALLLPLAFAERRWEQVLDLTVELRAEVGDDEEALMLGALTEAFVHGRRTIARGLGPCFGFDARQRVLWPALAQICEVVAEDGPLPRLDAVLGAAAALVGDAQQLLDGLSAWTAAHHMAAGPAVALARLQEAMGHAELSRHHYQLAAFLAPGGPVSLIAERLPEPTLPKDPLHADGFAPLAWRGTLREILIQLREYLAGIRGRGGEMVPAGPAHERELIQGVGRTAARWRERLGVTVPVSLTHDPLHAGIGIRNRPEPQVVVSQALAEQPAAERSFRIAMSMGAIATGLAIVTDTHPLPLLDLLDALAEIADPSHVPSSPGARHVADALAARGLRAGQVPAEIRGDLARELDHWLRQPQGLEQLVVTIRRATMLLATRLSGHLDGALQALARDQGLLDERGRPRPGEVLASPDAAWLLRTLGLHGG